MTIVALADLKEIEHTYRDLLLIRSLTTKKGITAEEWIIASGKGAPGALARKTALRQYGFLSRTWIKSPRPTGRKVALYHLTPEAHLWLAENESGLKKISKKRMRVLRLVSNGVDSLLELKSALDLNGNSSIHEMVERIEKAGLLIRRPTGKRSPQWRFELTPAGEDALRPTGELEEAEAKKIVRSEAAKIGEKTERDWLIAYAQKRAPKVSWSELTNEAIMRRLGLRKIADVMAFE